MVVVVVIGHDGHFLHLRTHKAIVTEEGYAAAVAVVVAAVVRIYVENFAAYLDRAYFFLGRDEITEGLLVKALAGIAAHWEEKVLGIGD